MYPRLTALGVPEGERVPKPARDVVVRVMLTLGALALPLVALLWWIGPLLFEWAFGSAWREAGTLAGALALYIGVHFVASPLGVVTMAWQAQGFALKLAFVGQVVFLVALAGGLAWGGLVAGAWAVSAAMTVFFGWYFWTLARWPTIRERKAAPA
jgi:O-antigen/teichoic acid export membrane protein